MSMKMDEDIKRWTAKRKSALVLDIIQGKTTVAEASWAYDRSPSEVESWVDDGKLLSGTLPEVSNRLRQAALSGAGTRTTTPKQQKPGQQ